jgi:hypothetical protein
VIRAVSRVFELTAKRGVLVVDRGFDAGTMFEDWLDIPILNEISADG